MGVLNTAQLGERIHFILVSQFGGDRVKVLGAKKGGEEKNGFDQKLFR